MSGNPKDLSISEKEKEENAQAGVRELGKIKGEISPDKTVCQLKQELT